MKRANYLLKTTSSTLTILMVFEIEHNNFYMAFVASHPCTFLHFATFLLIKAESLQQVVDRLTQKNYNEPFVTHPSSLACFTK